jgi:peptide/nickel transport system ATP-binding protein
MGIIAKTADRVAVMYADRIVEIGPVQGVVKRANDLYTAVLMASISLLDRRLERLAQIDGAMPRLSAIPKGCAFHPRCPPAKERWQRERPERTPGCDALVACLAVEERRDGAMPIPTVARDAA